MGDGTTKGMHRKEGNDGRIVDTLVDECGLEEIWTTERTERIVRAMITFESRCRRITHIPFELQCVSEKKAEGYVDCPFCRCAECRMH